MLSSFFYSFSLIRFACVCARIWIHFFFFFIILVGTKYIMDFCYHDLFFLVLVCCSAVSKSTQNLCALCMIWALIKMYSMGEAWRYVRILYRISWWHHVFPWHLTSGRHTKIYYLGRFFPLSDFCSLFSPSFRDGLRNTEECSCWQGKYTTSFLWESERRHHPHFSSLFHLV